ncbi:MAG: hypothetical protein AB7T31_12120 [Gemmatimonadales bacterium]
MTGGSVARRGTFFRGAVALVVAWVALLLAGPVAAQLPDRLDGVPYRSLQGTRASIRFAQGDSTLAARLLELVDEQPPLPGLPANVPSGVTVMLTHAASAFEELTGGAVPEWRAGVAIPAANLMVIPAGEGPSVVEGDGRRTLRHEWAHLGLHGYLGDLRVPRWFDEGYAQWASGGFDASEAWRLRVLLALDRAPSMDSLMLRWPADLEQARVAYLLSASAVSYLLEASGERGLTLFLDRWRAERSFDRALRLTFGVTPGQFEEDWRAHVRDRYGWLLVLSHSSVFWLLITLVMLFLFLLRRRRDREKLARLRATEPPDDPAYWADVEGGPGPSPRG